MKKKSAKATRKAREPEIDPRFKPVVQAFAGVPGVKAGKLFASYGLKVKGKIFAMYGRGRLVVKLPKERVDEMVGAGKAERFNPGHGRLMKEWAAFQNEEAQWVDLAHEAHDFVKTFSKKRQTVSANRRMLGLAARKEGKHAG